MKSDRSVLAKALYVTQVRIRCFEETVARLFAENRLPGFVHLSIGQEAVAAGVCAALREDDVIATTHRGHGHCIAKGADVKRMMAELFGRQEGYCQGVGGSMHIADLDRGILGANGIVGASIPIATGAAFSFEVLQEDRVAVAFFGDGAVNQGGFYEALNMAALWKLPVIYLCENNGYAELTPVHVHLAGPGITVRAQAFGVQAISVNGVDALAVYDAVSTAAEECRQGRGPFLVEARTYRWHGHYEGDQQAYRPREELEEIRQHDPVRLLAERLLRENWATASWLQEVQERAEEEMRNAVAYAMAGRGLAFTEMLNLVYPGADGM